MIPLLQQTTLECLLIAFSTYGFFEHEDQDDLLMDLEEDIIPALQEEGKPKNIDLQALIDAAQKDADSLGFNNASDTITIRAYGVYTDNNQSYDTTFTTPWPATLDKKSDYAKHMMVAMFAAHLAEDNSALVVITEFNLEHIELEQVAYVCQGTVLDWKEPMPSLFVTHAESEAEARENLIAHLVELDKKKTPGRERPLNKERDLMLRITPYETLLARSYNLLTT